MKANRFTAYLLLVFAYCLLSIETKAISKVDSLKSLLPKAKSTITKAELMMQIADELLTLNTDSAVAYYKKAIVLSAKSQLRNAKLIHASALHKLGNVNLGLGQWDDAMTHYLTSKTLREQINDEDGLSKTLNNLGILHSYLGETQKSIDYYRQSLVLRIKLHDSMGIAGSMDNLGMLHQDLGNLDSALYYFNIGLKLNEQLKLLPNMARTYNNLASLYKHKGDINNALEYYRKSLKISEQQNDSSNIANVLVNIGFIHKIQNDFLKTIEYYNKGLAILYKLKDQRRIAHTLNNFGDVYHSDAMMNKEKGHYRQADSLFNKALEYYNQSLGLKKELNDKSGISISLLNIGIVYKEQAELPDKPAAFKNEQLNQAMENFFQSLSLSRQLQEKDLIANILNSMAEVYIIRNNLLLARQSAQEAYQIAKANGFLFLIRNSSQILYRIYEKESNYKAAFTYYYEYIQTRDSLNKEEDYKLAQQMHYRHEYEKQAAADSVAHASELQIKNLQIREQKERNEKQQLIIAASILGLLIVSVLLILIYRMFTLKKKTNILLEAKNNEILAQNKRIEAEKQRSEQLLLNILPKETAEELKKNGFAQPKFHESVTVLFADFKGFTASCAGLSPKQVVDELHMYFEAFDKITELHGLEKIKTIGDAYMLAGGLPVGYPDHALRVVKAAINMQEFVTKVKEEKIKSSLPYWEIRIGIHSGSVVAGVVGTRKFVYDIWGNTVNVASRMESAGEPAKINISETTYQLIKSHCTCEYRGKVEAKSLGAIDMYFAVRLNGNEIHVN